MAEDDDDLYLVPPAHTAMTEADQGVSFKEKLKAFQAGQAINNNGPIGPAPNKNKPPTTVKPKLKPHPIKPPPPGGTDWRPPLPPGRENSTPVSVKANRPEHEKSEESQRSDVSSRGGNPTIGINHAGRKPSDSFLSENKQAQDEIRKNDGVVGRPPVLTSRGSIPSIPDDTTHKKTSVSCPRGCEGVCRCDVPPHVPNTRRPFCYANPKSEDIPREPDDLPSEIAPPVPSSVPARPSIPVRSTPGQPLPTLGHVPQSRPLPGIPPVKGDASLTARPLPRLPSPVELERPLPSLPEPERAPMTRPSHRPLPVPPSPEPMIDDTASDWPLPPPDVSDWPPPPVSEETYDIPSQLHNVIQEDEYQVPPMAVAVTDEPEPESDDTYDIPSNVACPLPTRSVAPQPRPLVLQPRPVVPQPPSIEPEEDETYDIPGPVPVRSVEDVFAPPPRAQKTFPPLPVPPPRPKLSTSMEDLAVDQPNRPASLKSSKSTDFLLDLTNDERPSAQLLMVERTDKVIEYNGRRYQVVRIVESGASETDNIGIAPYDSEEERRDATKEKLNKLYRPPRKPTDNSGVHITKNEVSVNGFGGHDNDTDDASIDIDPDVTRRNQLDERFKQDEEKRLEEENLRKQLEKQKLKEEKEAERLARKKEKEENQRLKEERDKVAREERERQRELDREERKAKKRSQLLAQLKLENEEAANVILCTVAAIETTAVMVKMKHQAERFLTLANCLSVKIGEQVQVIRTDESVNGPGRVLIRKTDGKLGYVERRVLDLPRETDSAQSSGSGQIGAMGRPTPPPITTLPGYTEEQETYEDIGGTGYRSSEEEDLYEDFGG